MRSLIVALLLVGCSGTKSPEPTPPQAASAIDLAAIDVATADLALEYVCNDTPCPGSAKTFTTCCAVSSGMKRCRFDYGDKECVCTSDPHSCDVCSAAVGAYCAN